LSSKNQRSFICREEKGKAAWGRGAFSRTWKPVLLPRVGLDSGFYSFLIASGRSMFWHEDFGMNRCFLGTRGGGIFPWLIAIFGEHMDLHSLPFKFTLSMIALTALRNRDDEV
jgi:hypothetical protein